MNYNYAFAYEDRDEFHTSRWSLSGVNTTDSGNLTDGRLWMTAEESGDTVTVNVYSDQALGTKVAAGTADVSGIADAAAKCTLTEHDSSGLSGEFYFEAWADDNATGVEVLVALAMDADLAVEFIGLSELPDTVYDSTNGMADHIAAATQRVLLLVSQMYKQEVGGFGAPESRYRTVATRSYPDYRCLANVDQLRDTCLHWALMLAFGACHQLSQETMYSELRNFHDDKRREAIAGWNLTFNSVPDSSDDADEAKGASMRRVSRI